VFAILANTTRLRSLLLLLQHGELCVCELTHVIGAAQPNMSRHLAQLREVGLVADRRQGQWIYYQIDPDVPDWVVNILQDAASGAADLDPYKTDPDVLATMPNRPGTPRCA
jgi:ArsR family transcriptional regulator, arsenate/arsenite/antimonite-responsive transcriptional repressor